MTREEFINYFYAKCRDNHVPVPAVALNGGLSPSALSHVRRGRNRLTDESLMRLMKGLEVIEVTVHEIRSQGQSLLAECE